MSAKNCDEQGRLRSVTVGFRVSPEEGAQLDRLVQLSGLTKQDYILRRLMNREVVVQGNPRVYKALKGQMSDIFGFYLSYIGFPGFLPAYASHQFERNSRFFLQRREDFFEDEHCNITLHHNGVESFKDSNISCGLSKKALNTFGWSLCLSRKGFILLDSKGTPIGHHECYYAFRNTSNRYTSNQPSLQRWIIKRNALDKLKLWHIRAVVDSIIIYSM